MAITPYRITKKKIVQIFKEKLGVDVISIEKIPHGLINSTFVVTAEKKYILRVAPKDSEDRFEREKFAFDQWRKMKVPVPKVYVVDTSCKLIKTGYSITEWKPGEHLDEYLKKNREKARDLCKELGEIIKRMHSVKTKGYWSIVEGRGERDNWLRPLEEMFEERFPLLLKKKVMTLVEEGVFKQYFKNHLSSLECKDPRLVHRDLNFTNVLTNGKKITAILDGEFCVSGDPMYDLGYIMGQEYRNESWIKWVIDGYFKGEKPLHKKIGTYAFFKIITLMSDCINFKLLTLSRIKEKFLPQLEELMKKSHS